MPVSWREQAGGGERGPPPPPASHRFAASVPVWSRLRRQRRGVPDRHRVAPVLARWWPSGLKATLLTLPVLKVRSSWPVCASHTFPSRLPALARRFPSGLKATLQIMLLFPLRARSSWPVTLSEKLRYKWWRRKWMHRCVLLALDGCWRAVADQAGRATRAQQQQPPSPKKLLVEGGDQRRVSPGTDNIDLQPWGVVIGQLDDQGRTVQQACLG